MLDPAGNLSKGKWIHGWVDEVTDLSDTVLRAEKIAVSFICVLNTDEEGLASTAMQEALSALVVPAGAIFLDARFESELSDLTEEVAEEMLEYAGYTELGLGKLARLGLQTYLSAGPKETCAWSIHNGWTAPQAAGFINAEVVAFDDLVDADSMSTAGNTS